MSEYKCIACGYIRENDDKCNCPECGYEMFPLPYERKKVLISEIKGFIKSLMKNEVEDSYLYCYRNGKDNKEDLIISMEDDVNRFPSFEKVKYYCDSAEKTEKVIERINKSLEQIKTHMGTNFNARYIVEMNKLDLEIGSYEETLHQVMEYLGENVDLTELVFNDVKLDYAEIPNEERLTIAYELIDSLHQLVEKIYKFIRLNNAYGVAHQIRVKLNSVEDYNAALKTAKAKVNKILNKRYVVDIFSDGKEELSEMFNCLWNNIHILLKSEIFDKKFIFYDNGIKYDKDDFYKKLINDISSRYLSVNSTVLSDGYFQNNSETELMKIYNQMIEFDDFGFFNVDKDELLKPGEQEEKLNALIGLNGIKESVKKIKAYALSNKGSDALNLHMCFYGNPGTGKTEVARIIAGILYENKILPSNKVIEVDRSDLVGEFVGTTAPKTMDVISRAMGGVLFIDEAYSLAPKDVKFDYGHEAVATLIKAMEDKRGKFCVILAGYKNQMQDMLSTNPGFKSRIQFELEFPNYSRDELQDITSLMLKNKNYTINDRALQKVLDISDVKRREPNFANAREIRNILDGIIMCQNLRTLGTDDNEVGIADVNKYVEDSNIVLPMDNNSTQILTAEEELDQLIGLDSVKRMVKKIKAYAKKNKQEPDFNLHMCFCGNPGTGKTEVARIISSILYDAGVLPEAKLVETDSHGLIGKFVGETAPKTQEKIADAMGGVLFIDEAYGLSNSKQLTQNYGDEAIEVLLKNMEDKRGKICVILAGYKQEMNELLSSNPGFKSRIQFTLDFPDYTREELGKIAVKFLEKKKYSIDALALELVLDITDYYRNDDNFANARTIRNVLDQVIMNQNLRTEDDEDDDSTIIISDVEDYLVDENIDLNRKPNGTIKIGF